MDETKRVISWIPVVTEEGYWTPYPPFTTEGEVEHVHDPSKPGGFYRHLPLGDASLDPGVAELVHALNDAGITTVGSCEDISLDDDDGKLPVMIIEFRMEDWPKLAPILRGDIAENQSGWLVTANPAEPDTMAILFPSDECKDFLARVRP